jgi:DNA-damage-inducible protein D
VGDTIWFMQLDKLASTLEDIRQSEDDSDGEYWYARELYPLLGYKAWRNFEPVIERAKDSCKKSGGTIDNHFASVRKMVILGSGAKREIDDVMLSRYACYLIAQNGDPRIPQIAFAQMYFALQTRKQELLEKSVEEVERIISRRQLSETEKEFVSEIYRRGVTDAIDIASIKGSGDKKLFGGLNTNQMKKKLGLRNLKKPLADVLPSVTLKAKDLATEMTTVNSKQKNLYGSNQIKTEHDDNNSSVRNILTSRGIFPEKLPAAEDIKKVESRHRKQQKLLEREYLKRKIVEQKTSKLIV